MTFIHNKAYGEKKGDIVEFARRVKLLYKSGAWFDIRFRKDEWGGPIVLLCWATEMSEDDLERMIIDD